MKATYSSKRGGKQAGQGVREQGAAVARRLSKLYPQALCSLDFDSPFQLLIATILSAQCTDKRVNAVTGSLFGRWPTAAALAAATQAEGGSAAIACTRPRIAASHALRRRRAHEI